MQTTKRTRNGVDTGALNETISTIEAQPDLARFAFRANTRWQGGAHTKTTVQGFWGAGQEDDSRSKPFELEGDEPPVLLGQNRAPNAVETVLHALSSCLAVGFVYHAAARGVELQALDFDVEGTLDLQPFLGLSDEHRPGYDAITVRYRVQADAPRETIEELCRYVQRTSPVMDIITNPVPVEVVLEA
jgi:uncharacterized OsmC-like protein